jgi:hypothetical protein
MEVAVLLFLERNAENFSVERSARGSIWDDGTETSNEKNPDILGLLHALGLVRTLRIKRKRDAEANGKRRLLQRSLDITGYGAFLRPRGFGQHERRLNLSRRNIPIGAQQRRNFFSGDQTVAVRLVEANGPVGICPGADENALIRQGLKMAEQEAADAFALALRAYVRMANERDILYVLDAHDADEASGVILTAPEAHAGTDITSELLAAHVRLVPAIRRDNSTVALSSCVDCRQNPGLIFGATDVEGARRTLHRVQVRVMYDV